MKIPTQKGEYSCLTIHIKQVVSQTNRGNRAVLIIIIWGKLFAVTSNQVQVCFNIW